MTVLAGTGPDASRVAYVKTVRPGAGGPYDQVRYRHVGLLMQSMITLE